MSTHVIISKTHGRFEVLVDDCDDHLFASHRWCVAKYNSGKFYVMRKSSPDTSGKRHAIHLHRAILGAKAGKQVDHINGDTLDNRRSNLRLATPSENLFNRGKTRTNTSGRKGVHWNKHGRKWRAQIVANKKPIYIGYYDDIDAAARAYDEAALKYHGEFARTNSSENFIC